VVAGVRRQNRGGDRGDQAGCLAALDAVCASVRCAGCQVVDSRGLEAAVVVAVEFGW
jgi:hypothetical protein